MIGSGWAFAALRGVHTGSAARGFAETAAFARARGFASVLGLASMLGFASVLGACGGQDLELVNGANWKAHVYERGEPWGEALGDLVFRPEVCRGVDLTPEYNRLDENDLINYLRGRGIKFTIERPRDDLAYLVVDDARTRRPARLRVAILENADEAGRELTEAIAQHGNGSWGVHRSNLAVLGPVGDTSHDLAFAAETKLVCWGVFTVVGSRDTVVIPGGYREL